jgi:hypothetical protein
MIDEHIKDETQLSAAMHGIDLDDNEVDQAQHLLADEENGCNYCGDCGDEEGIPGAAAEDEDELEGSDWSAAVLAHLPMEFENGHWDQLQQMSELRITEENAAAFTQEADAALQEITGLSAHTLRIMSDAPDIGSEAATKWPDSTDDEASDDDGALQEDSSMEYQLDAVEICGVMERHKLDRTKKEVWRLRIAQLRRKKQRLIKELVSKKHWKKKSKTLAAHNVLVRYPSILDAIEQELETLKVSHSFTH